MPTINGQRVPDKIVRFDADVPTLAATKAITGATDASPIVVTATAHGYSNGDFVFITGVAGNTAANGIRIVANKATNTFEATDLSGDNVVGNGTYTVGGTAQKFSANPTVGIGLDMWLVKSRLVNTTAGAITFNMMDGQAPGTFKYDAVSLAADSITLEVLGTAIPEKCANGCAVWASATGVQGVIEGYETQIDMVTPAAGFSQPA